MKRILSFLILPLCFCGCAQNTAPSEGTQFYYPTTVVSYGTESSAIAYELREYTELPTQEIIALYLQGPRQEGLRCPFPSECTLINLQLSEEEAALVLSDSYAELSGLELSIANACLAKTVIGLTGSTTVVLCCETKPLAGEARISITQQDLILFDESTGVSDPNSATNASSAE